MPSRPAVSMATCKVVKSSLLSTNSQTVSSGGSMTASSTWIKPLTTATSTLLRSMGAPCAVYNWKHFDSWNLEKDAVLFCILFFIKYAEDSFLKQFLVLLSLVNLIYLFYSPMSHHKYWIEYWPHWYWEPSVRQRLHLNPQQNRLHGRLRLEQVHRLWRCLHLLLLH